MKKIVKNLTLIDNKQFWANSFNSVYDDHEKFVVIEILK